MLLPVHREECLIVAILLHPCLVLLLRPMAGEVEEQTVPWLSPGHQPLHGGHYVVLRGDKVGVAGVVRQQDHALRIRRVPVRPEQVFHALHIVDAAPQLGPRTEVVDADQQRPFPAGGPDRCLGHLRRVHAQRRWHVGHSCELSVRVWGGLGNAASRHDARAWPLGLCRRRHWGRSKMWGPSGGTHLTGRQVKCIIVRACWTCPLAPNRHRLSWGHCYAPILLLGRGLAPILLWGWWSKARA
mmetsp:Transcript_14985/g.26611  ORF Transcript_14985/g.26611 Transcript_14985/m.26611 type:complete len:242 (+) Transcript_14985:1133-1858(+)